jgi:ABC-type branched-subunit amino acid transport system ATPase component
VAVSERRQANHAAPGEGGLTAEGVTVRFGGLTAVDDVTLHAPPGAVTGLIGPNGAGKTTLFNACTGAVSMASGRVWLGERRLDHHSTAARAARGLGRTFQRMELFDSMTVAENVSLGPEALCSARRPWGQLAGSGRERREIARRAGDAMARCGLDDLGRRAAGDLSTGQRRLVELARAMASPFRFLLLDEPSSGLDIAETETFARVLSRFVADTAIGVLLVEHDMALVSKVCSYTYMLDFGRLICSGPTAEVLASPEVQAAYLGSETLDSDGTTRPTKLQTAELEVAGDV